MDTAYTVERVGGGKGRHFGCEKAANVVTPRAENELRDFAAKSRRGIGGSIVVTKKKKKESTGLLLGFVSSLYTLFQPPCIVYHVFSYESTCINIERTRVTHISCMKKSRLGDSVAK